jgi:adenine-specific DNA-methyltransferase
MTPQEQLQNLLRELFQLDNSDLDFGIYRILNLKHKEVEEFITTHLPKRIEEVREKILARQSVDLRAEIEQLKQQLSANFQVDFQKEGDLEAKASQYGQLLLFKEPYDKYIEAKKKLDALHISEDTERAIYNELYRFFDRYYEGGDFISKPRAGANNYMIPYNGEEVKLYWANYDQYYIKTSENFKNYVFTNNSSSPENRITVEFKIVDAETTVNNNKDEKKRLFVPTEKPIEWDEQQRKLTVSFYYKEPSAEEKAKWGEKQSVKKEGKGINQHLYAELEKAMKKTKDQDLLRLWESKRRTSRGEELPLFLYHLNRYTSINSFDYFIHKDLKGFLSRELDYFLKNEVLSVNFLDPDWKENEVQEAIKLNILKASAIRDLALTIIDFLGELEDFQKRLWEKKKFVVQSDYCLTLDTITDEAVLSEVLDFVLNDKEQKQVNEWVNLGFISSKKDLKNLTPTFRSGKDTNLKYLVLDTQFLPEDLKWKLLASIDNLDEKTNGLLINSENWQALTFASSKLGKRVDCIYLDPPFNSKTSEIAYKNNYKHSSWIALLYNRLDMGKGLLKRDGTSVIAIDENEQERLGLILDKLFIGYNKTLVSLVHNPRGIQGDNFSYINEFAYFLFPSSFLMPKKSLSVQKQKPLMKTGSISMRTEGRTMFYPIYVKDGKVTRVGEVPPDDFHPTKDQRQNANGEIEVWPIDSEGGERKWRYKAESLLEIIDKLEVREGRDGKLVIYLGKDAESYKTIWQGPEFNAAEYGSTLLKNLGIEGFSFPKSLYTVEECISASTDEEDSIVLDYFGGSATTAHAVINLNREDDGERKYILVEVNKYFDSVTKPRVQKVIFSDKWKEGKPQEGGKGISQIFQYLKLEQYEDTLNNIEFTRDAEQLTIVDRLRYLLTYGAAESDCLLNVAKFTNPFGYTMKIVRQNEIVPEQPIDLVTTFNYFLGIDVKQYVIEKHQGREYRIVLGKKRQQEYIIVWRPFDEERLDLTKEREWIKKQPWYTSEAIIYCNADNGFGAHSTEAEFKRIMNERVE